MNYYHGDKKYPCIVRVGLSYSKRVKKFVIPIYFNYNNILSIILLLYRNIKAALDKREKRTTMTLFMICFCYFLFVMPIALVNIIDDTHFSPQLHLALFCVYWLQYSLNFFIYAARSEQYRKAYWYFLRKVSSVFKDCVLLCFIVS